MDHMRISGIEPYNVILTQTKYNIIVKVEMWCLSNSKQVEAKKDFIQFQTRTIWRTEIHLATNCTLIHIERCYHTWYTQHQTPNNVSSFIFNVLFYTL